MSGQAQGEREKEERVILGPRVDSMNPGGILGLAAQARGST